MQKTQDGLLTASGRESSRADEKAEPCYKPHWQGKEKVEIRLEPRIRQWGAGEHKDILQGKDPVPIHPPPFSGHHVAPLTHGANPFRISHEEEKDFPCVSHTAKCHF